MLREIYCLSCVKVEWLGIIKTKGMCMNKGFTMVRVHIILIRMSFRGLDHFPRGAKTHFKGECPSHPMAKIKAIRDEGEGGGEGKEETLLHGYGGSIILRSAAIKKAFTNYCT